MKYVAVRDHLADLIDTQLSAGDAIPSERDLADQFGVSRMTVRRAIDSLVADAVLARRQGSGTYVAQPKMDVQARMTSFTEEMRQRGMIPGSRLIRAEQLLATPDVAAWLGISIHDRVHFVHRVRLADGVPMAVEKTWVAVDSTPTLISHGVPESMYQALADAGMVPTWGEDTIESATADETIASLLHVPTGAPLLAIARRTYANDRAVSYSRSWYRGDRYKLWVPISSPGRTFYPPRRQGGAR